MKKCRILAIPSAVGRSHLTRLGLIARELRDQGAEVLFAFRNPKDAFLEQEKFRALPVADVEVTDFSRNIYAAYTPALIEQCIQDELKVIESFQPDLILGDLRLTAAISARVAGAPYVSVVNGYMTDYFNPVEAMLSDPAPSFKFKATSWLTRRIQNRQKKSLARPFRAAARKYGLKSLTSLYDFLAGALTLITDLPQFCPLADLPAAYRYIGPLIWEGLRRKAPQLLDFDSTRRLIYATTGHTGQRKLVEFVAGAVGGNAAYQVIVTTGAFIEPETLPRAANIHVERFIPGAQIIPLASAVIHCGGSGTTYQTLQYGAPALVIPFNNEQRINAWLVKKHEVGIPLSPKKLTASQVKETLESLLESDVVRENVERFQGLLLKTNGPKSAAAEIGAFLAKGPADTTG